MDKICILSTSATGLTREIAEPLDIHIVPFYVNYSGKTEKEDFAFDRAKFYQLLPNLKEFPTTAQPSLDDVEQIYRELLKSYDWIIHLELSSKYSTAYEVSLKAKEKAQSERIILIDSQSAIGALALATIDLAEQAKEGKNLSDLLARYDLIKNRINLAVIFETLEYLAKGGRIHRAQALMGSLLSIHPILAIKDGMTVPVTRVRSHRQGLDWMKRQLHSEMERLQGSKVKLFFEDTGISHWREIAREEFLKEFPVVNYYEAITSVVAGAHIGPGAWGVSWQIL